MEVKWIKIVTNIFDDEKIKFIETMPNGDETIVIWFKLLCLTGKCNLNGFLMITEKLAYTDEMLSSIFNRDIKSIQMALKVFENLEMIEIVDNKIYISNWEKHQNVSGLEKIREQTRKRVANHRERKKIECNVTCNDDVTPSNETEIDIDIELDKELDKDKKKETYISIISNYTNYVVLKDALKDYVEMRKKTKGFTTRALKLNLKELDKLTNDDVVKLEIVNQTIMNSWKSFYPLKTNNKPFNNQKEKVPQWFIDRKNGVEETTHETSEEQQKELDEMLARLRQ